MTKDLRGSPRSSGQDQPHAGEKFTNQLIHETSPYLLQHAHNPVDWLPWGAAAFERAQSENKPLFLSFGYATCHWCHVMEEESFSDLETAEILNTHFIPVKIDREEHPHIDQTYLLATQIQNRGAGWPNSIWALPDGRPFHTGTYFQNAEFKKICGSIANGWERGEIGKFEEFAESLSKSIRQIMDRNTSNSEVSLDGVADYAVRDLEARYNLDFGGFSEQQQFPMEINLLFLLDHAVRENASMSTIAQKMAIDTLAQIDAGGLHDQVGGGFHRYTVDVNWRTPHFEKMLYNQALIARSFAFAYNFSPRIEFERATARCLDYVFEHLTAPSSLFYTGEDADSMDELGFYAEGAFYVFREDEVDLLFEPEDIIRIGLDGAPTVNDGMVPHRDPRRIVTAADLEKLDATCAALSKLRSERKRPKRDEKIILGWNGLMLHALAEASLIFNNPEWARAAGHRFRALKNAHCAEAHWYKISGMGAARLEADLSDIAWLGEAALAIFATRADPIFLEEACALANYAERFLIEESGRYALSHDGPLGAVIELDDNATPAGESALLSLFVSLYHATADLVWHEKASNLMDALSGLIGSTPTTRLYALTAIERAIRGQSGPIQFLPFGAGALAKSGQMLHVNLVPGFTVKIQGDVIVEFSESGVISFPNRLGHQNIDVEVCSDEECFPKSNFQFFMG